jgi:hypothetical protein
LADIRQRFAEVRDRGTQITQKAQINANFHLIFAKIRVIRVICVPPFVQAASEKKVSKIPVHFQFFVLAAQLHAEGIGV